MESDAYMPSSRAGDAEAEPSAVPAPYGTELHRLSAMHLFGTLPGALGLRPLDVMTPWAIRTSDGHWQVIEYPETNYEFHAFSAADLKRADAELFGHEVPFVAIVTSTQPSEAQAAAAFLASPFVFHETQAVFSQFDKNEPPRVWFVSWGERRDELRPAEKTLDQVAKQLGGMAVYGLQVPRSGSTVRRLAPAMPFDLALEAQVARERPSPPAGSDWGASAGVGAEAPVEKKIVGGVGGLLIAGTLAIGVGLLSFKLLSED